MAEREPISFGRWQELRNVCRKSTRWHWGCYCPPREGRGYSLEQFSWKVSKTQMHLAKTAAFGPIQRRLVLFDNESNLVFYQSGYFADAACELATRLHLPRNKHMLEAFTYITLHDLPYNPEWVKGKSMVDASWWSLYREIGVDVERIDRIWMAIRFLKRQKRLTCPHGFHRTRAKPSQTINRTSPI